MISGLDELTGLAWGPIPGRACVFRAAVPSTLAPIAQLFFNGEMMVEARWPNLAAVGKDDGRTVGDAAMAQQAWRTVGKNTTYGRIVDPVGLRSNFSWAGALATLNVGHQCKFRKVQRTRSPRRSRGTNEQTGILAPPALLALSGEAGGAHSPRPHASRPPASRRSPSF